MNNSIIELKNICKAFDKHFVLDNICLKLHDDETASMGASVVGKTTLINLVGMLESPDKGEIYWNDTLVSKIPPKNLSRLRGQIFGFILQSHNLIYELNVIENILLPVKIHGSIKRSDLEFANFLQNRVGLIKRKFSQAVHLSGGEKQRIAIVRALINHPKVVLADEPTGNLDEDSASGVIKLILDLCEETRSSILFITHNKNLSQLMDTQYILFIGNLANRHEEC